MADRPLVNCAHYHRQLAKSNKKATNPYPPTSVSFASDVLSEVDSRGLVDAGDRASVNLAKGEVSDEELLASLGVEASAGDDVTQLVHVRSRDEIKAAEEIAQRSPCEDFDEFKPIFEKVQRELEIGERQTVKYKGCRETPASLAAMLALSARKSCSSVTFGEGPLERLSFGCHPSLSRFRWSRNKTNVIAARYMRALIFGL